MSVYGECLRPALAYQRFFSCSVCVCSCWCMCVDLDQNEVCHKQTQVWSVLVWV